MLQGLSHLTLAVSNLEISFRFYTELLQLTPHARWETGAYLSAGDLWLCLSWDANCSSHQQDYTHTAFSVSQHDFSTLVQKLRDADVSEWKRNRSEGDSFYFLDPDGHQLELHVGCLQSRLAACKLAPYKNMVFYSSQ